jgi:hypothetical protein
VSHDVWLTDVCGCWALGRLRLLKLLIFRNT